MMNVRNLRTKLAHGIAISFFLQFLGRFVHGKEVLIDAPDLNHAISYINSTTKNAVSNWRSEGNKLKACPSSPSSIADAYSVVKDFTTSRAKEIAIDIKFHLTCCTSAPHKGLHIGFYILKSAFSSFPPPSPMANPYIHVADLTNTSALSPNIPKEFSSRYYVDVEPGTWLTIAFRDEGFCGSIDEVKVKYFKCEGVIKDLATYPEQAAPRISTGSQDIQGTCAHNAFPSTDGVKMICYANGTSSVIGGCICRAGFENNSLNSVCSACPPRTFKPSNGNFRCKICGSNTMDGLVPRTSMCKCLEGFYKPKELLNDHKANCHQPPSAPMNLTVLSIGSTWAHISWKRPNQSGTGNAVQYLVRYETDEKMSLQLNVTLHDLEPFKSYNLSVASINNVTETTGNKQTVMTMFKTLPGVPSMVRDLGFTRNDNNSVTVSWKVPQFKHSDYISYAIRTNSQSTKFINATKWTAYPKNISQTYNVSVQACTITGCSMPQSVKFSIPGTQRTVLANNTGGRDNDEFILVIVAALTASGIALIILLVAVCIWKRRKREGHPQEVEEIAMRQFDNQGMELNNAENAASSTKVESGLYLEPIPARCLSKRKNSRFQGDQYDNEAYQPLFEELSVKEEEILHNGKSSVIYHGYLDNSGRREIVYWQLEDFDLERKRNLQNVKCENVVQFLGIFRKGDANYAVFEYVENGSLMQYLKAMSSNLDEKSRLQMAWDIAKGMTHLSMNGYIHKHLSADNILLTKDGKCKVNGLTLTNQEKKADERFTPPEVSESQHYTTESDVWSYGVLLRELMQCGLPSSKGQKHKGCKKDISDMIWRCCVANPKDRPRFKSICQALHDRLILGKPIDLTNDKGTKGDNQGNNRIMEEEKIYSEPIY